MRAVTFRTNKVFKLLILFLIFLFVAIFSSNRLLAQAQRQITGTVVDESTNQSLAGVSVQVRGTTNGVLTNESGEFKLAVNLDDVLIFSFVGFKTKEIAVENQSSIEVLLEVDNTQLSEVVVNVGYGTRKKETLTGSVTSISGGQLEISPNINLASTMQGLLPGTTALQASGEPGRNNPAVSVRGLSTTGNNSPLVVVDGVPTGSEWQDINSEDIESISVLKDASAAIYGARAANGVILITTKRGTKGKPLFTYSYDQGITMPTMLPKVANSAEFADYVNQLSEEEGQNPVYTPEEIQKFSDGSDPEHYRNTDWYSAVVKNTSTQSKHNLSIRGGTDNVRYSISGSYTNQNSIFKNGSTNFKTYGLRSNIDMDVSNNIKLGVDVNAGLNDGNYPAYSTATIFQGLLQVPFQPVFWSNGLPSAGIEQGENPAIMATDETGNNNNVQRRFQGKVSAQIIIPGVNGLSVDGFFAYTRNTNTVKNWQKPWTVYEYDEANDEYISHLGGRITAPQLTESFNEGTTQLVNLRLNYHREFGSHNVEAFIAGEQAEDFSGNFSAFRRDYLSPALDQLFAGSLLNQSTDGSEGIAGRRNLFGRVSYGFKEKYLIDFNFRYDGSSTFAKGKQYGFFPGISAAWRMSQEDFLKNSDVISNLKLRGSYGEIGNDRISAYQYLRLYSLGSAGYNFGASPQPSQGLVAGVTPNPDVTWEKVQTTNVGLDLDLWRSVFNLTVDLFKQRRSNILTTRDLAIPFYTGLVLPNENIGVVDNKGLEVEISYNNQVGDFSYRIGGNFAYNKSKVIDLSEASNIPEWQRIKGHKLGAETYYQAVGIFRTQEEVDKSPIFPGTRVGDLQYRDVNGDGEISSADMVITDKTSIPEITYGVNFIGQYKGFSLWLNFYGQARSWNRYHLNVRNAINGYRDVVVNRYTPGSMDSKYPRLPTIENETSGEVDAQKSDFWLFNTSYLRLKTLQLGYTFNNHFLNNLGIDKLKVYASGNDLFTISKMKLFDPANTNIRGQYYPLMRVYNLGVNISF